jgi:predicted PurR-regulated permease PerM
MSGAVPSARAIAKVILISVGIVFALYLIYLLRTPLLWLFISIFLAVALSRPVNFLNRYMKRGLAIAAVYLAMFAAVVALGLLMIPPIVSQVNKLADNAPTYAQDVRNYVDKNRTLRKLERDYDITKKVQDEAAKLPSKLGGAAGVLRDVGFGLVSRIFELITILVLTAFLLGSGRTWVRAALDTQPPDRAERLERILQDMAGAVSGYVNGALVVAFLDGLAAFLVLTLLGVPFAAPLGVLMGIMALIPLVGATIGAVIVGIVTAFSNFPTNTIIWVVYAIAYQQFENNFVQPQVQRRTVQVHPFVVLVSVLFGATLLGIVGALVAIPIASSIKILLREWTAYRADMREAGAAGQMPLPDVPLP